MLAHALFIPEVGIYIYTCTCAYTYIGPYIHTHIYIYMYKMFSDRNQEKGVPSGSDYPLESEEWAGFHELHGIRLRPHMALGSAPTCPANADWFP